MRTPVLVGAKLMLTVQLAFDASTRPQLLDVLLKSPDVKNFGRYKNALPLLVNVIGCEVLVAPAGRLANDSVPVLAVSLLDVLPIFKLLPATTGVVLSVVSPLPKGPDPLGPQAAKLPSASKAMA